MLVANFILRHIIRHWGMNLAVLLGLSLGAGLLGSLPTFAAATAAKSLDASLMNSAPSVRNIQVIALPQFLSASLNGFINDEIEEIVNERISVSNQRLLAHNSSPLLADDLEKQVIIDGIWVWSIDKIRQHSSLLEGKWPEFTPPRNQVEALKPPTVQAAISENVANDLKIEIGDQLQDNNDFKYLITSIIRITDPEEDVWWDDKYPFRVTVEPGLNEDTIVVPVIVNPLSMKDLFPFRTSEWRYVINSDNINIDNIDRLESKLIRVKNQISAKRAQLTTGLLTLVQEHRQNLSISQMVLYLLSSQAFLVVIFTLILMASLLVNNSQSELVTMTGRGASRFQIITAFAIQILILALIAGLVLGPLLSRIGLFTWSWFSGDTVPGQLPSDTWRMSLLAAGIGWLAIMVAIIPATKINILDWQQTVARPGHSTGWQTSNVDIFLLIVAALLYWQLSNSGSFVMRRLQGTSFADPLLLIGPSLLLIALAMFSLRLLPIILKGLARLAKTNRGALLPIGLTRIARNPQRLNWVILLVSLTAALTLFARIYSDSLNYTQEQIALYQAGSNLRLDLNKLSIEDISNIVDEVAVSQVSRGQAQERSGRGITVLAVDPESFANVSKYPEGMTNLTMKIIMGSLSASVVDSVFNSPDPSDNRVSKEPVPAIFSYSVIPKDGEIGDRKDFTIAGESIPFKIQGMIADFPTLSSDFIIVNAENFDSVTGISISEQNQRQEGWIITTDDNHEEIVSIASNSNAILADSRRNFEIIRSNIFTIGTVRAFGLNAFILATISLAGLVLANYFSYRQRVREFGILKAIGFSGVQTNRLLIGEGILVLGLGLISGFLLGFGLARLMRPYISLAVSRTLPGMVVRQISLNWMNVIITIAFLIILYGLVFLVLIYYLRKSDLQQTLRMGDE